MRILFRKCKLKKFNKKLEGLEEEVFKSKSVLIRLEPLFYKERVLNQQQAIEQLEIILFASSVQRKMLNSQERLPDTIIINDKGILDLMRNDGAGYLFNLTYTKLNISCFNKHQVINLDSLNLEKSELNPIEKFFQSKSLDNLSIVQDNAEDYINERNKQIAKMFFEYITFGLLTYDENVLDYKQAYQILDGFENCSNNILENTFVKMKGIKNFQQTRPFLIGLESAISLFVLKNLPEEEQIAHANDSAYYFIKQDQALKMINILTEVNIPVYLFKPCLSCLFQDKFLMKFDSLTSIVHSSEFQSLPTLEQEALKEKYIKELFVNNLVEKTDKNKQMIESLFKDLVK